MRTTHRLLPILCALLLVLPFPAHATETPITFADPVVEATIRSTLKDPTMPLTPSVLSHIRTFTYDPQSLWEETPADSRNAYDPLSLPQITTLSDFAHLPNLQTLTLKSQYITDLTPLSSLQSLQELHLLGLSAVSDITPLASLSSLQSLSLHDLPAVTDITPLSALQSLEKLSLQGLPALSDVSPLGDCKSLATLEIHRNTALHSLSGLEACESLNGLFLWQCTGLADLSALAGIPQLQFLSLFILPAAQDLSPLSGCKTLTRLSLSFLKTPSLDSLAACENLVGVYLSYCDAFTDLTPLTALPALKSIQVQACAGITDYAPLAAIRTLTELEIDGGTTDVLPQLFALPALEIFRAKNLTGPAPDFSVLSGSKTLTALDISGLETAPDYAPLLVIPTLADITLCGVDDATLFTVLEALPALTTLSIENAAVTDAVLPVIASKDSIEYLSFDNCPGITDLSGLPEAYYYLGTLTLRHTGVTDLAPLTRMFSLSVLNIVGSPAKDLAPIADIPGLSYLIISDHSPHYSYQDAVIIGWPDVWVDIQD